MPVYFVYKPLGYTPKQIITILQKQNKIPSKASFSGRLDPLAKGWLKILTKGNIEGDNDIDDCKEHDKHLLDDKIYHWDLILGIGTDTSDGLGIPLMDEHFIEREKNLIGIMCDLDLETKVLEKLSTSILENSIIRGERDQEYPIYSSVQIRSEKHGRKALWWYAKNNFLDEISYPNPKKITIHNFNILEKDFINLTDLSAIVKDRINRLQDTGNNFRQKEILENWEEISKNNMNFVRFKCKAKVSTGCYIRKLSEEIGEVFNTYGMALDIERTEIGYQSNKIILEI